MLTCISRLLGSPRVMNQFPNLTGCPNIELIHLDRYFSPSTNKQTNTQTNLIGCPNIDLIHCDSTSKDNPSSLGSTETILHNHQNPSKSFKIPKNPSQLLKILLPQDQHRPGPRSTLQPSASPQDSVSENICGNILLIC